MSLSPITMIILTAIGLILGFLVGFIVSRSVAKGKIDSAERERKLIISNAEEEAESRGKAKLMESKERFLKLKSETDREISKKKNIIQKEDSRIEKERNRLQSEIGNFKKEKDDVNRQKQSLSDQLSVLEQKKSDLDQQKDRFDKKSVKLDEQYETAKQDLVSKLEKVGNMSADDAREQLMDTMKKKAETEGMALIKEILDEAKMSAAKQAKKIVIQSIQRTAAEQSIENTVSVFNLQSDDQKGQIIGREGRNIRALEAATGVEIIVDDTPEAVIISGYDPFRREMARLALQRLVADGRIHPARIEEVVAKTKRQLEQQLVEIGERTVIELNINGLHPELIKLVGRMRFRSSYGQNLLQHSKETANLCAIMASELGLDVKLAKRAGLLHDIGKVSEDDPELSHALLGMKLAERYKEKPAICNAIGAHHDEVEMKYTISPIIQACDAISGSRPGARREILEQYLKRIKDLENIAMDFKGVDKAYAIQAGRELRVIVESEKVSDETSEQLSFDISQKIQNEMQYPGQIKVTVIREMRAVNYAK